MRKCLGLILVLLWGLPAAGQTRTDFGRVQWRFDVDFWYYFDNREYDASEGDILRSGTTHAAVLTPTVSAQLQPSRRVLHQLTAGVDLQHDMGSQTWSGTFREGILYYDGRINGRKGAFEMVAGIWPRSLMKGYYSEALFSDRNRFDDRNFEGLLLKWSASRFRTETALDWLGQRGYDRKERFQIISAGHWQLSTPFSLGWAADYYHYAGSELAPGVVDHGLLHPWLRLDLASGSTLQELSLRAGALLSYQWDRRQADKPSTPSGGELTLRLKAWNVALENNSYFGADLLPLYDDVDLAGHPYADNLYFGHRLYTGFYDRVQLFWEPQMGRSVRLFFGARAHFTPDGFQGWQQCFSLRFDFGARMRRP